MSKSARRKEHRITLLHVLGIAWFFIAMIILGMPDVTHAQDKALENLKETGKAFASVAKNASPAVVFIRVEKTVSQGQFFRYRSPFEDEFFKRFFGEPGPGFPQFPQQQKRQVQSQGSGFIITQDGYILTNNHVVGDADRVTVKLLDGREFTAKTVGTDPPTDVAVIKIDAESLPVLSLGDSDRIEVGEWVLALGNPFGLSHTLTAGIVSAKGRSSVGITDYEDFIQTDAAINPGNSGGPLIDLLGKVVGINTAIYSRNGGGYMGIGFAIPVNMAKNIYTQLIEHGNVTRGYLGVTIQDLTAELAKSFGLNDTKGVLVSQVMPDTPAEKAGMKQGDVIVSLDGKPVDTSASLRNEVAMTVPGTAIKVGVIRDGKKMTLNVKVEKMSEDMLTSSRSEDLSNLGMSVATLNNDLAKQYGFENESGVVVTGVDQGSLAARTGIRPGMLIKEIDRKPVKNVKEFEDALKKGGKKPVLLFIKDNRGSHFVAIDPGK
ncbi:MAG: DegQ family serine endoprotease [Desulfomonilia bacterium]|jgi:serine protease Do|nr:DegQ family serine endoprotease [Desulfomonilia bacterium]